MNEDRAKEAGAAKADAEEDDATEEEEEEDATEEEGEKDDRVQEDDADAEQEEKRGEGWSGRGWVCCCTFIRVLPKRASPR